jgi:peptidyl-prolyl cis-trans isomerase D
MFDSIRSSRWVAFVVMLPVFLFFVISGVYGFMQFRQADSGIARVDGTPITAAELDAAQRERLDQYRQMFGQNFDPKVFDTPRMRAATLESLMSDRALERAVDHDHVLVADAQVDDAIRAIPAFQRDGKFDLETAKVMVQARGYSEAGFRARMRDDLSKEALVTAVTESAFLPNEVVQRLWQGAEERLTIRLQRFEAKDFSAKVALAPDAVKAYYDAHTAEFRKPETVKAEYVVLSVDDIAASITPSADDVKTYYEQNKARYTTPEQRRASHILITFGKDGSAPDKEAARKKATELLARLRADPNQFESLAREFSKDPGSAAKGGDLGWFGRGMMVKPFEEAAFALAPGTISDVVESDFGFHLIRVTDSKGGGVKSFDEARPEIEAALRREQAAKTFADSAEQFTNLVYEQSASLQPAADRFKLKIQTVDGLTRRGLPAASGAPNVFGPQMTAALFSADSLSKKQNVPAVEIGPNALASARVVDYQPAATRPLDEVRAAIQAKLEKAEAARLAGAAAADRLKALQAQGKADDAGFAAPIEVSRDAPQGLPATAVLALMHVPADKLPAFVSVDIDPSTAAVVEVIERKEPAAADPQLRTQKLQSWTQEAGRADDDSFVQALRRRFDARVLQPDLVAAAAAPGGDAPESESEAPPADAPAK